MRTRTILTLLAASLAVLAIACGTDSAASPTSEVTPTAVPIDLITADPSADPVAFRASLSASEAECYDGVEAYENGDAWGFPKQNGPVGYLPFSDDSISMKALHCYDNDTLQRLFIGQVDRLSGGLSNTSLNCMVEHTANTNFSGLMGGDEDAVQPDNLMSIVQSIFCLNDAERLAFETSLAGEDDNFRTGMIDGLECTVDYRDSNGRLVVQDAIILFSLLSGNDPVDENTGAVRPEVREAIGAIFDVVPAAVECGLITDEDLADSGITTQQLTCAAVELKQPLIALMDGMAEDPDAEMDFAMMAGLFAALGECDIDLNDIEGMESLFGAGMGGGFMEFDETSMELGDPSNGMSLEDLEGYLTAEQIACLEANLTEADMQQMMETGQPPATMFVLMATCNITLDQFLQGF